MRKNLDHLRLPTVGIVINTYKRPQSLERVLQCIADQKHTDFREIDVAIVNDGSHQHGYRPPGEYNEHMPFEVVYFLKERAADDNPRLYSLKNFVVRATTGDVIWLLDDDLVFDDHTLFILRLYHMLLESARPVLVAHYADKKQPQYYQDPFAFMPQPVDQGKMRAWVSFAGLSLWRRDFEAVGGIDERYDGSMGFADMDLGLMLHKDGCQVILVDGITCFIDDSETGSHRDKIISRQFADDPHRNGRLFIEKWSPEVAAEYGVKWTKSQEEQTGIRWNGEKFVR